MKEKYFKQDIVALDKLKNDIRSYAQNNELEFQEEEDPVKGWVCQIKKDSKKTLGILSKAVTVIITPFNQDLLRVSIGEAKWMSKVAGGLVGLLGPGAVLTLVFIPMSIVGAVKQKSMNDDIERFIKIRLSE